jgi:hypothetical protein
MSDIVDITLLSQHRVFGSLQAEGAQCAVHLGVAENLIERGIAEFTNEPAEDDNDDGGE